MKPSGWSRTRSVTEDIGTGVFNIAPPASPQGTDGHRLTASGCRPGEEDKRASERLRSAARCEVGKGRASAG